MSTDRFWKGNRARVGYLEDGSPLLVVAGDIAPAIKTYSLAFGENGELSFRIIFKDDSTADFTVDINRQEQLYSALLKYMGFTVVLSAHVGDMNTAEKYNSMPCVAKPFKIDFSAAQIEALQSALAVFKSNYS